MRPDWREELANTVLVLQSVTTICPQDREKNLGDMCYLAVMSSVCLRATLHTSRLRRERIAHPKKGGKKKTPKKGEEGTLDSQLPDVGEMLHVNLLRKPFSHPLEEKKSSFPTRALAVM